MKKEKGKTTENINIPRHVAIIMDGNGRWAKLRGLPRNYGHNQGAATLKTITEAAASIGIEYLTVYAFSTENWKRPKEEIDGLMSLFEKYLDDTLKSVKEKDNVRIRFIGDLSPLTDRLKEKIAACEQKTKDKTGITVCLAVNYGGRQELLNSIKKIAKRIEDGEIKAEDISEEMVSNGLYTAGIPEPDLIIRPSGEYRLSNFLMWQSAYSELWFDNVLWPDFTKKDLERAVSDYSKRNRRFGGL